MLLPLILPGLAAVGAAEYFSNEQPADMGALNHYMTGQRPKTSQAQSLKDAWVSWYANLSWYEQNVEEDIVHQARNRVAQYDRANTTSDAELANVKRVQSQSAGLEQERRAAEGEDIPLRSDGLIETDADRQERGTGIRWRYVWLGGAATTIFGLGAYVIPSFSAKIPLGGAAIASFLGTGTYVAFKIDRPEHTAELGRADSSGWFDWL
jgi:hypothetical protein